MKIIIDLGLQKTGSKARQQFFMSELQRLSGLQALYPAAGRQGVWHNPLFVSLRQGDRSDLESILHEIDQCAGDTDLVILSYEEMYKLEVAQIQWLKDAWPDLVVIIFLRCQDQLVNSLHNQMHKSHMASLQDIEEYESRMLNYDNAFDSRATLARWSAVIGYDAVIPILYQRDVSSVMGFFDHAGIEVDWNGYVDTYPNRSIDATGLAVLREVKRLIRDRKYLWPIIEYAHRKLARNFLQHDDSIEHYTLTLQQRRKIMSAYEESNEWVRKKFFPERDYLFPPIEPGVLIKPGEVDVSSVSREIVREAYDRLATKN